MSLSAPTVVATITPSAVSPRTLAYNGVPGRLYLLWLGRSSAADPYTTVTDNSVGAVNVWQRLDWAPKSGSVGRRIELWACVPTAAFTTVSAAFTGAGTAHGALLEVTGQATAGGHVNVAAADFRASSAAPAALNITPTVAGTLVVAAVQANPQTTAQITPSAGWSTPGGAAVDNLGPDIVYRLGPPANAPLGVAWTFAAAAGSGHGIAAFVPAPEPTGPTVSVWDGAVEQPATVAVWDGAIEQPATVDIT